MQLRARHSILRWAILSGYAWLVLLGHGGTHWMLGDAGCADHRSIGHAHLHAGHSHEGHRHVCPHHPAPEPDPQSPEPAPIHDPDHCSIGGLFETPLTIAGLFELPRSIEIRSEFVAVERTIEAAEMIRVAQPRGPPALCQV